jgi:N-acetylglutamate synthase-like GNAT family acetyltransferase
VTDFEPAHAEDLPFIEACVRRFKLDGEHLEAAQLIVLREAGRIVAFGRIKPYEGGVYELGAVGVVEERRGRGLGDRVVRELVRRFPAREVWITTDLVAYFERFGFRRSDNAPRVLVDKIARVCGSQLREGVVPMVLVKEAS